MGNKQSAMASSNQVIVAFDLYGTILDTASIKGALGEQFGKYKGAPLAVLWRRFQLEYTWRLNSMNQYRSFTSLTRSALIHALDDYPQSWSDPQIDAVMAEYANLAPFPDIPDALALLQNLADAGAVVPVLFTNGDPDQVTAALQSHPDIFSEHESLFKATVSAAEVQKYKPHPEVYYHLAEKIMGAQQGRAAKKEEEMGRVWVVSGNSFDVVGAKAVGCQTVWIRSGQVMSWTDRLVEGEEGRAGFEAGSVREAVEIVAREVGGGKVKDESKEEEGKAEEGKAEK